MTWLRRLSRDSGVRIVAAVVAYVAVALAALAGVVLAALSEDQRADLVDVLGDQVPTLVIGAVVALAGLTALLLRGPGAYPRGARRMTGDVQVLLTANPHHRVDPQGPPELVALAGVVNELADRREAAEGDVAASVAAAGAEVERERDLLAALMADLDVAVLVCSPAGRLLLYNAAARALLGDQAMLGLGRSVFAIVDRTVVTDALARIAGGAATVRTPTGRTITEFPLSTLAIGGMRVPVAGGGYFRLFPYAFTRFALARINARDRLPFIFYLHPWEIDPEQPRIKASWLSRLRHYTNLDRCEARLKRLLGSFRFGTAREVLAASGALPATSARAVGPVGLARAAGSPI